MGLRVTPPAGWTSALEPDLLSTKSRIPVSKRKADGAGMVDKNGKPGGGQFKITADQIRVAADQLRTGEPVSDHSSVALNQAFAHTPALPEVPPVPAVAKPAPSRNGNGTNGASHAIASGLESHAPENHTIDLISTDAEMPEPLPAERPPNGSPLLVAAPVIDLASAAAEPPFERRPNGSAKPVIGAAVMLPRESAVERVGEAFPEPPVIGPMANGASKNAESTESSLGMYLLASREKRVVTREDAARDTRIPAHYLRMMESNDYSMIADQLYLLPFLRRYAEYLGLDSEDVAIRFVREVQRAENSPLPTLPSTGLDSDRAPSNRWVILGAIAIIVLIGGWMLLHQRHHVGDETADTQPQGAMPADNSGPPLPETTQGSAPATNATQENAAPVASQPIAPQPAAAAPSRPAAKNLSAADAHIPPPGGTE
jgi:hypothetical protein